MSGSGSGHSASHGGAAAGDPSSSKFHCGTCRIGFAAATAFRSHFRSIQHRLNAKRKIRQEAPLAAAEVVALGEDEVARQMRANADGGGRD